MMPKDTPKKGSGYWSNSSTSSEETPRKHFFISKKFIAPEPNEFPLPTFQENKSLVNAR